MSVLESITKDLTKTRAKKSLLIDISRNQKSVLDQINKLYKDSIHELKPLNDKSSSVFIEFKDYHVLPQVKTYLSKTFKDFVKVNSALMKQKKVKKQERKEKVTEKPIEQHGQHGDRNRSLFEIRIPKLILRNLNFKVNEDELKQELEKFGKVDTLVLAKKPDGTFNGFGFATFANKRDAQSAINELNSRKDKFLGSKVAVDWCLPKNLYLRNKEGAQKDEEPVNKDNNDAPKAKKTREGSVDDSEDHGSNEDEDDEEEVQEDDNDEQEEEEEGENDDENRNEDEEDIDEDDEEEDDEEENEQKKDKEKKSQVRPEKFTKNDKDGTKDVKEKRTIFVRNLSFDASEEVVRHAFEKYGEVKYCKLCFDRDLERPRGTAFVQFATSEGSMAACAESNILEIDSRRIQIDLAVSRDQATSLNTEKKEKVPKDNRNLALVKEGLVYPNSYEGKELSKSDLQKREKLESASRAKLKILHYFVSTTRLSVHNLPTRVTDAELRKMFLEALGDVKNKRIVECRIMRDLTRVNSEGVAKSKGFGFVEFSNHEQAFKALHALNNNPNVFADNKTRLIVQFSIEDIRAIKKKAQRFEKQTKDPKKLKTNSYVRKAKKLDKNDLKKMSSAGLDPVIAEDVEKVKEKNLIRMHQIERKLSKRKNEEDKKDEKKLAKKMRKIEQDEAKQEPQEEAESAVVKPKRKRNRKPKSVITDSVDKLVDNYLNQKNNRKAKKSKWYE